MVLHIGARRALRSPAATLGTAVLGAALGAGFIGAGFIGAGVPIAGAAVDALHSASSSTAADQPHSRGSRDPEVRFATFNASLNRASEGQLVRDLSQTEDPQAAAVAEIIQRSRPDVLLLNEFDYVRGGRAVDLFRDNYLERSHRGSRPIDYPYAYLAPSNTGIPSGHDLDNNGTVGGGNDAFGFGEFPGQYGMVVLSRYPIDTRGVRTFQRFRWRDLPGALLPDNPDTRAPADWYSPAELRDVRLSSKSHWDVPIRIGRKRVHFLVSHPTPPTFDGAEDRNGKRNHDEIRFWADYISGRDYLYDDRGRRGGLRRGADFVIAGDQNSDPRDGDSVPGAIQQLVDNRWIIDPLPTSRGAVEASARQGGANLTHRSNPRYDTADFADAPAPGNLRADYVLPSRRLEVRGAGVFWPTPDSPLARLTGEYPFPSSDHRAVWVDVKVR